MIYVATAHFGTDRWIDVQLGYLGRNLHEPFEVFASLEGVPAGHEDKFSRVVRSSGPHAGKLNLLAAEIGAVAGDDDLIAFLDGDAFPVADPMPTVRAALGTSSLVAIRRDENATDVQPHPAFCMVTVGEWRRLHGDWSAGHCWQGKDGGWTTDVGGNLLRSLELAGAGWTPLLRSNRVDLHPLWYGVYGGVVYHHGAGFRWAIGRVDLLGAPRPHRAAGSVPGLGRAVGRWDRSREQRFRSRTAADAQRMHEEMFAKLSEDPDFYRALL